MTVSDDDLTQLAIALDDGRDAWIHGKPQWEEADSLIAQSDDATIFGPFGGVAPVGQKPIVQPGAQRQIASMFLGGSGSTEVVRAIVEGDLVVVVYVDRSTVQFGPGDEGPWAIRVTEVLRKNDNGQFVRVHRHADPLLRFRDLPATRSLME
jgi:ketosteroid isomerase-like protein